MFDLDEAFHALEHLDAQGRLALQLVGKIHEEVHAEALSRVSQAEYLLRRLDRIATDAGLDFDLDRGKAEWELLRRHPVTPLTKGSLSVLSERTEEVRDLRARLDDVLDSRERAELRAEKAEHALAATRALATHWGLGAEFDRELASWRPHCRREPRSFVHEERIDQLEAEVQLLRRESRAAREAEYMAIEKMRQARLRAEAAEAEVGRLRGQLNF